MIPPMSSRVGHDAAVRRLQSLGDQLADHTADFFASLDDDLNISGAMGHLFDLIRDSNRAMDADQLFVEEARRILGDWARMNDVLGLSAESQSISDQVLDLVVQRQAARAAKNWAESDRVRDEIAKLGWNVKDTKDGPKLTPA